jgi:hypothetical protein
MFFFFFDDLSLRSYLAPYSYNKRRRPTTYGTFKKNVIRFGTKGNYKIHDYNTHELHNILIGCGVKDICNGHILELGNKTDAVWAKLNFENIMNENKDTKMIGLYGPVDLEPLREYRQIFNESYVAHNQLSNQKYHLENYSKAIDLFQKNNKWTDAINPLIIENTMITNKHVITNMSEIVLKMTKETNTMKSAKEKMRDYMESIKLS